MKKKTLVLGLDGATWKLLRPFAENGTMPTLRTLLDRGIHGTLESTYPAMTAPAWTTFVTGKNPGHHGVFDFMLPTDSLGNMKFATGKDIRDKTLYEVLYENGYRPILINLPGTFPPRLKDTITITSLLTQGDEWIFPASLKQEFPELEHYRLTPNENLRLKERREQYIDDLLKHMEEHMTCVKRIFQEKPWDFFFYLFSHTDWISHLAYTELEETHEASALRIFKKIDEHLQWFVDRLPEGCNLVLLSDHGFKAYKKVFYFNKWLEREGYLTTNTASDQFRGAATRRAKETDKIRATKKRIHVGTGVFDFLSRYPLLERAAKWSYHHVVKKYLPVHVKVHVGIDFSKTKICFPKGSYITNAYINKAWVYTDGIVSRDEYLALRSEVVEKMKRIKDPEGKSVIARVLTREEVYGDAVPDTAPDIFFELSDYWLVGQFHSGSLYGGEIQNKHDQFGIFLGMGPDFPEHATIDGLNIQDLTPILLHLLGLPVPKDCDGHVRKEIFRATSDAATRPVLTGAPLAHTYTSHTQKSSIQNALRNISI